MQSIGPPLAKFRSNYESELYQPHQIKSLLREQDYIAHISDNGSQNLKSASPIKNVWLQYLISVLIHPEQPQDQSTTKYVIVGIPEKGVQVQIVERKPKLGWVSSQRDTNTFTVTKGSLFKVCVKSGNIIISNSVVSRS